MSSCFSSFLKPPNLLSLCGISRPPSKAPWFASLKPPATGTCCPPCTPDPRGGHGRRDELLLPLAFPHLLFTSSSFPSGGGGRGGASHGAEEATTWWRDKSTCRQGLTLPLPPARIALLLLPRCCFTSSPASSFSLSSASYPSPTSSPAP